MKIGECSSKWTGRGKSSTCHNIRKVAFSPSQVADKSVKEDIRRIVEEEEETNYKKRMGEQWVKGGYL